MLAKKFQISIIAHSKVCTTINNYQQCTRCEREGTVVVLALGKNLKVLNNNCLQDHQQRGFHSIVVVRSLRKRKVASSILAGSSPFLFFRNFPLLDCRFS